MVLYGSDLSPYTRRVAIWCALQGRPLERRKLRIGPDNDAEIGANNPVVRVPALKTDDGQPPLVESWAICDWLDDTAPDGRRLVPATGAARRAVLQRIALAHATTEKAVAMVYERNRRPEALQFADWMGRIERQVRAGLGALEAEAPEDGFHGGETPDGSDIAVVAAVDFLAATNAWLLEPARPRLAALSERANRIEAFAGTKP